MPGRKKDPSVRARENVASTARTLPVRRTAVRVPALPRLPRGRSWHAAARAWWNATWRSPMSVEFLEADRHSVLTVLALLMNDFHQAESPAERGRLAAEIRLQRATLGLTPYDRLRLEWRVGAPDQHPVPGASPGAVAAPTGVPQGLAADDPRRGLHAVPS